MAQISKKIGRGHAERLAPMVNELLSKAGVTPNQIDRIAVCSGPGSFTGLRVALAFAKSFALPRKIPVTGFSALELMAMEADPKKDRRVLSLMDVRRGELCWALYENGSEVIAPKTQAIDGAITDIKTLEYDMIVGNGAGLIGATSDIDHVSGSVLADAALSYTPHERPVIPVYSRPPDAKLPGGKSL